LNSLEQKIYHYAQSTANKIAIEAEDFQLDYKDLLSAIKSLSVELKLTDKSQKTFAFLIENHPAWAILDLALFFNQQCAVPLPHFFSSQQILHTINDSNSDYLITELSYKDNCLMDNLTDKILSVSIVIIAGKKFNLYQLNQSNKISVTESRIVKITYTSGTTDKPKGVLLSEAVIISKMLALSTATEVTASDSALSIFPLSTLLENIGSLYVSLYCGACFIVPSPKLIGVTGSSQIEPKKIIQAIIHYKPTAFIIIPQLLLLLIQWLKQGNYLPDCIRFIAMGGAPVSKALLEVARQLKIPVFEGYGLSEAASVVAVNTPSDYKTGSVGKVLKTHQVKIEQGEILVKNHLFNGYLGQATIDKDEFYCTGDIGYIDEDGFLFISGRKKNIINTTYGRNISPEWLEKDLEALTEIAQCVVYGHGKSHLVALLVLRTETNLADSVQLKLKLYKLVEQLNGNWPDYARIHDFIIVNEAFTVINQQLTGTGRPVRSQIYKTYQKPLEQLYA